MPCGGGWPSGDGSELMGLLIARKGGWLEEALAQ